MINSFEITVGFWKKISNAGESGSAWPKIIDSSDNILISHTESEGGDDIPIGSTINMDLSRAYPLNRSPKDLVLLEADGVTDVYYASLINDKDGAGATILADFA